MQNNSPIELTENWLCPKDAQALFSNLMSEITWSTEEISMFGKRILVPRRIAWFGDEKATYSYSRIVHCPMPWTKSLCQIREKLLKDTGINFNSVLCNLYRNGRDYMGWHQDNEPELGDDPIIASISLGSIRKFLFRHKLTRQKHSLVLTSGSLLMMKSGCQKEWQHSLPKTMLSHDLRINLTFRTIVKNSSPK